MPTNTAQPTATSAPESTPTPPESPTPTSGPEPTDTPIPSATPTPPLHPLAIEFIMSNARFLPFEQCWINLRVKNMTSASQKADLYILLEVFGQYFCYPSWVDLNEGLDRQSIAIPSEYEGDFPVLPAFAMPECASAGPFHFYGLSFSEGKLSIDEVTSNLAISELYIGTP
jgi:hypothetical protein